MRIHTKGLLLVGAIVLITLTAGAMPAVALLRLLVVLFVVAAFGEIVVNIIRHRDMRVRSRLLGSLFVPGRFGPHRN